MASGTVTNDTAIPEPELDEFDYELLSLSSQGLPINTVLGIVESRLGLSDGGSWWLDPSRSPIEVIDSLGTVDDGAIADAEAQAYAWLRSSFDRNPDFAEHNYHLLDRLEELARLNGLSAEVSLSKQERVRKQRHVNKDKTILDVDSNSQSYNEISIFHSTLSLMSGGMDECGNHIDDGGYHSRINSTRRNDGDVYRSTDESLLHSGDGGTNNEIYHTHQFHQGAAEAVRRIHKSGDKHRNRPLLTESVRPLEAGLDTRGDMSSSLPPKKPIPGQIAALPHLQKSQQPPSPSPRCPLNTKDEGQKMSNLIYPPNATSSPNRRADSLYRTYSKDQLVSLRDEDHPQDGQLTTSQSQPYLLEPNQLRSSALTYSIAVSDRNLNGGVTNSLNTSEPFLGNVGVNPLSLSMSAVEQGDSSVPSWTSAFATGVRSSVSATRSTEIYELARQQESNLRKHHSGDSRGKLTGSNNSLTGGLLTTYQPAGSCDLRSDGGIDQSSDIDSNSQEVLYRVIEKDHASRLSGSLPDTNRNVSVSGVTQSFTNSENEAMRLSVMSKAASQLEILRASRDRSSKLRGSSDGTPLKTSTDSLRQSTTNPVTLRQDFNSTDCSDNINSDSYKHTAVEPDNNKQASDTYFFGADSYYLEVATGDGNRNPKLSNRPDSQQLFDQLEAGISSPPYVPNDNTEVTSVGGPGILNLKATNVSYDLQVPTVNVDIIPKVTDSVEFGDTAKTPIFCPKASITPSVNSLQVNASSLPRFSGTGSNLPTRSRISNLSVPIRPAPGTKQTGVAPKLSSSKLSSGIKPPTVVNAESGTRPSRIRTNTALPAQPPGRLKNDSSHPRVHQSDTSPVRSSALRNPRLGQRPKPGGTGH